MSYDEPARYQFFPETFFEGRDWFRHAATRVGARLDGASIPGVLGPGGETLSTEWAWFGSRDAKRLLVSISGTHGQEYFAGAAGQLQWMYSGGPSSLSADTAVCLIHAHNPYGAAYLSRGNENFVDLNRNYTDEAVKVRPNALYAELFNILFTREMNEHVLDDVMAQFYDFFARHDRKEAMTAMGGGQTSHPTGTLFCGSGPEWSTRNLKAIVRNLLNNAEKVALIDWHTGLGAFGEVTIMAQHSVGSREHAAARTWWDGAQTADDLQGEAKPDYVGVVCEGVAAELRARGAAVVDSVVEIGTFANKGVLAALLIDRWLRFECEDPQAPTAVALRTKMIERLNPSLPEWRELVLTHSRDIYMRTLAGLAAWS